MELNKEFSERVEEALKMAGIDPILCRSEAEGQWNLKKDDLEVWIDLLPIEQNDRTYLQIMSPIALVPADNTLAFLSELLEINYQIIDASFWVFEGGAYLKIMREIDTLRADDVLLAINRVGYYASVVEKDLTEKYKVERILLDH
jgi:hypothetical protein